jgi:hypothetical protein
MLNAFVLAWPSNSWAMAADPPASAAAAPTPCAARRRSIATTDETKADASEKTTNDAMPAVKMRLRPNWSASAPAAMSRLPNVSMNALVIQVSAAALPPRSRPIAGVAMAPPEKLKGSVRAARQTANSTQMPSLLLMVEWLMAVTAFSLR